MNLKILSNSPEQTYQTGAQVSSLLKGKEILLLSGDLGAGKTLFTKGLASALGVDAGEVTSPTFTVMNEYYGKYTIYHIDLYRLGGKLHGAMPEIDDNIDEGIIVIEWAQYIPAIYFRVKNLLDIQIQVLDDQNREINIKTGLDYIQLPGNSLFT